MSYMIYSPAFDAPPARLKEAVYRRLVLLSGEKTRVVFGADRRAVVDILRETKKDLPE